MADYTVEKGLGGEGPGNATLHTAVATLSDGGTYDTGLSAVNVAVAGGTSSDVVAAVTGNSDGELTVSVQSGGSAANDEDIHIFALGER